MGLNVVCFETAIGMESGAKRTSLARAQRVASDRTGRAMARGQQLLWNRPHWHESQMRIPKV